MWGCANQFYTHGTPSPKLEEDDSEEKKIQCPNILV
jgi:hypothetical protein